MIETALIGPVQQWNSHLPLKINETGKRSVENFRST